jgi:predicted enzyme related to lactoylglutathione lyase
MMSNGEFRYVCVTSRYAQTVAFYRDGLALPVVGGWDRAEDDRGTLFRAASGIIEVILAGPDRESSPPRGSWLLAEVDDVDAVYRQVRERGLPVSQELIDRPWGHREFQVTDPNGLVIGLFSQKEHPYS